MESSRGQNQHQRQHPIVQGVDRHGRYERRATVHCAVKPQAMRHQRQYPQQSLRMQRGEDERGNKER